MRARVKSRGGRSAATRLDSDEEIVVLRDRNPNVFWITGLTVRLYNVPRMRNVVMRRT